MQRAEKLRKRLEYARFTHLFMLYSTALLFFLFTNIPHKFWILLTVLVINAGIQPGLILRRSIHRVAGTLLALFFLIPLLFLLQLNYRLIPVVFILAMVAMTVTTLNVNRYDINVFFVTIVAFFVIAQTVEANMPQGPFEMVINRGVCTLIGVTIVIIGDYFLFQAYRYSQRLYLFHQRLIYDFLKESVSRIDQAREEGANSFVFTDKLRNDFVKQFSRIAVSAENLKQDLKTTDEMKQNVIAFQETIWEIRRIVFALCFLEIILPKAQSTTEHREHFKELMHKAKNDFINLYPSPKMNSSTFIQIKSP